MAEGYGFGDDSDVEKGKDVAKFFDYDEEKKKLSLLLLSFSDSFIEISNEGSDISFAVDELRVADPTLFYVSMGFLGLTLFLRFLIALSTLWKIILGELKFKEGRIGWYVLGVLLSLIEPMAGSTLVNYSLDDEGDFEKIQADSPIAAKFKKQREESKPILYNSLVMVFFEDIPEIAIEFAYLIRTGGKIQNTPLFIITTLLSLFHFGRVVCEIWFEKKSMKHIPDPDDSSSKIHIKGDIEELKKVFQERFDNCHRICSIELECFSGEGTEMVENFVAFMIHNSKSLGWMSLHNNQITDVSKLGEGLQHNNTLYSLELHNNQITDVSKIGEGLQHNESLAYLDLYDNQITDVSKIGEGLQHNKFLIYLHLHNNQITDVSKIGEGFQHNNTLKHLYLLGNQITAANKEAVKRIWNKRGLLDI